MAFHLSARLLLFTTVVATSLHASVGSKWGYHDDDTPDVVDKDTDELSPNEWGLVYPACNGTSQSPIDIETSSVLHQGRLEGCFTDAADTLGLSFSGDCSEYELEAESSSFHWVASNESTCSVHVESSGMSYDFVQFHMHMASEHTVNGESHAGEVHFVYTDANGGDGMLVLGLFLEDVANDASASNTSEELALNSWVGQVWNTLGAVNETVTVAYPHAELLDLRMAAGPVYNYAGSLTTPPCSEVVDWWVLGAPVYMTENDLDKLKKQLETREATKDGDDARPTQPLNGRSVLAY